MLRNEKAQAVLAALAAPELSILDLEPGRRSRYAQAIIHAVRSSSAAGAAALPSHTQLQELVDDVNAELNEDLRRLEAGLEKTRVKKKKQPSGVFLFFWGFLFFVCFYFFFIYLPRRERDFR
ncbi:MAG: hypothetical protein ACK55Z_21630, partial [bacterium]